MSLAQVPKSKESLKALSQSSTLDLVGTNRRLWPLHVSNV
jgi:hypothetical protein